MFRLRIEGLEAEKKLVKEIAECDDVEIVIDAELAELAEVHAELSMDNPEDVIGLIRSVHEYYALRHGAAVRRRREGV